MTRSSHKTITQLLSIMFLVLLLGVMVSPASSIKRLYENTSGIEIPYGSSQLYTEVANGITHFTFVSSSLGYIESGFEGESNDTSLYYGNYDPSTGNKEIIEVASDVIPYFYNFVIDSKGVIHLIYVAADEELKYITYNPFTKVLSALESITNVDPIPGVVNVTFPTIGIRAADPFMAIDENDYPRVIFAATFNDDADTLGNDTLSLENIKTIMYMAKNSTGWYSYDLMDNSDRYDHETEIRILPSKPSMLLSSIGVYFTWNNKFQLAAETRLQYMYVDTQFPDNYVRDDTLALLAHPKVDSLGAAVEFRRTEIIPIGSESILLLYGSEVQGGPRAAYLKNKFGMGWELINFDDDRSFRGVDTISGVKDEEGIIYITWSMKDKYAEFFYEFDVYMGSVAEEDAGSLDNWDFTRLTLSDNIDHLYPNVNIIDTGSEITYIKSFYNSTTGKNSVQLVFATEIPQSIPLTNPTLGLFVGLVLVVALAFGIRALIMKVPLKEKEVELMPHMINLKDSIEHD